MTVFGVQQQSAIRTFADWIRGGYNPDHPVLTLAGVAGTGKSTIAKHLMELVDGRVECCAFTGKAVRVMQTKGMPGAMTIHRLIYKSGGPGATLDQVTKATAALADAERATLIDTEEVKRLRARLTVMTQGGPRFTLNQYDSPARGAALIIVDEGSMIDRRMGADLESFRVPILVLYDPAQLPPVANSEGYFTRRTPDVMLDEVYRQALDSPILRLATTIRTGGRITREVWGSGCKVVAPGTIDPSEVLAVDQVIVGRNKTRHATNAKIRRLLGRSADGTKLLPVTNDRLVCLRNNYENGLVNGSMWTVQTATDCIDEWTIGLALQSPDDGAVIGTSAWTPPLLGDEVNSRFLDPDHDSFGFGYAITCHKAQGSEYRSVVVFDESAQFSDRRAWLYTAVTRASHELILVS